ncbi:MAG: hypothetical protein WC558_11720, partial [Patulibacter sp.]
MLPPSQRRSARGPLATAFAAGFDRDPSRVAIVDATGTHAWSAVVRAAEDTARTLAGRDGRVGALDLAGRELLVAML